MANVQKESTTYWKHSLAIVSILMTISIVIRLYWANQFDLVADEAYYYLWSSHLDFSYHDHPAGIALLIYLSTTLFGTSELGLRIFNSLTNVLTGLITYYFVLIITKSKYKSLMALVVSFFAPFMLVLGIFTFPDSLMLFLLILVLIAWYKVIFEQRPIYIIILPTFLFMNTKYNSYLVIISLFVSYIWFNRHKIDFKSILFIITIISISFFPVLFWNYIHNWSSFVWQFDHVINGVGPRKDFFTKISEMIQYYSLPVLFYSLIGIFSFRKNGVTKWLLFIAFVNFIPLFFSALDSARNLLLVIIPLLIASSIQIDIPFSIRDNQLNKKFNSVKSISIHFIFLLIFSSIIILNTTRFQEDPFGFTNYNSLLKDSQGFSELTRDIKNHGFLDIVTPDYGLAGQLQYYLPNYNVFTNWPQYRLWENNLSKNITVISFSSQWGEKLDLLCNIRSDTYETKFHFNGDEKIFYYWNCIDRKVNQGEFLTRIDYNFS